MSRKLYCAFAGSANIRGKCIFDEKRTAEVLQLPEGQIVAALVPMGYPAQEGTVFKRKTVDELVRFL